jgi:hypothetical protein
MTIEIMKKAWKKILILATIFTVIIFSSSSLKAATISNREVRITDSRPSQSGVIYDFSGDTSNVTIKCIRMRFCTLPDGLCLLPNGLETTSAIKISTGWNVFNPDNWQINNSVNGDVKLISSSGENGGNSSSWVIGNIKNPSSSGTFYIRVNTYEDSNCTIPQDFGIFSFSIISGIGVSVTIGGTGGGGGGGNPVPVLFSINPSSVTVGSPGFIMNLTGTNFIPSSIVRFNGSNRQTEFIDQNHLRAEILSSDLTTPGVFPITVFNPSPGGGESNSLNFTVNNPIPTLTLINPSSVTVDSPGFIMNLTGTNFIPSSIVRFNGSNRQTEFIDQNHLRAEILSSDLTTPGVFPITVFNPSPGGGESNSLNFTVNNPIPTLTLINPSSVTVDSPGFIMTLTGSNFIPSSVVRFAGSDRPTTYINSTTLQAEIFSSDLQNVGYYNITVFNPSPGGGESNAIVFQVVEIGENPLPILTSINPTSVTVGSPGFVMVLTGAGFIPSSVVRFNNSNRVTIYVNSSTLQAEIPASDLTTPGYYNITVFNPSPGGGESNAIVFTVNPKEERPPEERPPEERPPEERPPEERPPEERPPEERPPEERREEVSPPIILKPLDGTIQNKKIVEIEGKAQANQPIDIFVNEEKIKTVFSDKNGDFKSTIELEEGEYFLFLSLKGVKSKAVKIIIDLTPPPPPKLLKIKVLKEEKLIENFKVTLLVKGQSSKDTVSLKFFINPEFLFPVETEKWEKTIITDLSAGEHSIYAIGYDLAKNESEPSNVLTFKIGLPLPPVVKEIKEVEKIVKKVIDNPKIEETVEKISPIAVPIATSLSVAATASAIATTGLSLFRALSLFYLIFTQPFVLIFSKRRRGWGVVYNSLTKQPIDLAIVRLFDAKTNKLLSTKITDKEGRFIFFADPGVYKITVDKPEYKFPSSILAGLKEDLKYFHLYFGEEIEVTEKRSIINVNIPLDPEKEIKPDPVLIKEYFYSLLKKAIPIMAFIMSFLFYTIAPNLVVLIFFILNFILYLIILFVSPRPKKDWGVVREKEKRRPLPLSVVRIFEANFNKLLDQQVTNFKGQYGFLVGGRKFYLIYSKKGYKEKRSDILNFEGKEKGKIVGLDVFLEKSDSH